MLWTLEAPCCPGSLLLSALLPGVTWERATAARKRLPR